LFKSIEVLPGGTVMSFTAGADARRHAYFDRARLETSEPVPEERFLDGFCASLKSAVNDAVAIGGGTAVSLTGGLDSRMIMACLDALPGTVPCYTFGSMYRETLDVTIGREVAAACAQPYAVLELGREFLRAFDKTLEKAVVVSDGYLGVSGAAELYVNRAARAIAPGRMTGNWGGELLRGVRAFKYRPPGGAFLSEELRQHLQRSAALFASTSEVPALSFTLFHQAPDQGYGRYAIERSQVVMRSPFLDNHVVEWLYRAPASSSAAAGRSVAVIEAQRPALLAIPTDQGHLGTAGRPAAAARRLARRLVSKAEYLTGQGAPQWLARMSAPGSLIERQFRGRNKFQHFRLWFRSDLSELVRETLLDDRQSDLRAWFPGHMVERIVEDHVKGRANYTDEIDKLLTVAITNRRLLAAPAPADREPVASRP
jgi:asparagine synthase (glutamine-hydrolysing)